MTVSSDSHSLHISLFKIIMKSLGMNVLKVSDQLSLRHWPITVSTCDSNATAAFQPNWFHSVIFVPCGHTIHNNIIFLISIYLSL